MCSAACNFIKKETLTQVFSCEFCEISKNTFSYRTPPVAASGDTKHLNYWLSANIIFLNVAKTKLVISKSPRKVIFDESEIKLSGKKTCLLNLVK